MPGGLVVVSAPRAPQSRGRSLGAAPASARLCVAAGCHRLLSAPLRRGGASSRNSWWPPHKVRTSVITLATIDVGIEARGRRTPPQSAAAITTAAATGLAWLPTAGSAWAAFAAACALRIGWRAVCMGGGCRRRYAARRPPATAAATATADSAAAAAAAAAAGAAASPLSVATGHAGALRLPRRGAAVKWQPPAARRSCRRPAQRRRLLRKRHGLALAVPLLGNTRQAAAAQKRGAETLRRRGKRATTTGASEGDATAATAAAAAAAGEQRTTGTRAWQARIGDGNWRGEPSSNRGARGSRG